MLFKFRKIAILALCLVMVCGLSAAVYATSAPYESIGYIGDTEITATAKIERYYTYGAVVAVRADELHDMAIKTEVWMNYLYLDSDLSEVSDEFGVINYAVAVNELRLTEDEAFAMVEVSYDLFAHHNLPTVTERFARYVTLDF